MQMRRAGCVSGLNAARTTNFAVTVCAMLLQRVGIYGFLWGFRAKRVLPEGWERRFGTARNETQRREGAETQRGIRGAMCETGGVEEIVKSRGEKREAERATSGHLWVFAGFCALLGMARSWYGRCGFQGCRSHAKPQRREEDMRDGWRQADRRREVKRIFCRFKKREYFVLTILKKVCIIK